MFPPWYIAGFAGFFDCLGSGLQTFSLFFVAPSIYSIGKNAVVIFTAFFSVFYLKKKLLRHQTFSICVVMFGFILVALSTILFEDETDPSGKTTFDFKQVIGIVALFLSLIFQGFCYCYEENIIDKYEVNVMYMMGFESLWGIILSFFIFLFTAFINCPDDSFCNLGEALDNPAYGIYHLWENNAYLYYFGCCLSIMFFNLFGLYITKQSGAVFRVILDTLRTIIIWIIGAIVGFEDLKNTNKLILEIIGFLFLLSGIIIYNEILTISICGLDRETQKYLKKKEEVYESLQTEPSNS